MARKIHDHDQRTQATEANLKSLPAEEAPITSKDVLDTPSTPPYKVLSMSKGQPGRTVKTPCISADGTILATQLKEFILGAIKHTQDKATPSHSYVKQHSSRIGNVFEWYTELEPDSIESCTQLEGEFLNRFFSTKCTVSMIELANAKRRQEEPVIDFINRWGA
ncbi:hypothetical protein LIER_16159 [Lithospermum erythrorhizon]|uniref:Retrotransposon gag domain-containing protein n=1 Tax=Lithospermum erythrorhizon TaxID=34254 RepID=A0AAV3Q722_LITER